MTAHFNRLQLFHVLSIHQYKVHQYTEQFVPFVSFRVEQITIFSDFTRENRATSGHLQQERQVFAEQQDDRQVQGQQHWPPGEDRQGETGSRASVTGNYCTAWSQSCCTLWVSFIISLSHKDLN